MADAKQMLVALAQMVGYDFPELEDWKSRLFLRDTKMERRGNFLGRFGMNEQKVGALRKLLEDPQEMERRVKKAKRLAEIAATTPLVQPVRSGVPKVGRNDPCPCGSGKKYKKYCGA